MTRPRNEKFRRFLAIDRNKKSSWLNLVEKKGRVDLNKAVEFRVGKKCRRERMIERGRVRQRDFTRRGEATGYSLPGVRL